MNSEPRVSSESPLPLNSTPNPPWWAFQNTERSRWTRKYSISIRGEKKPSQIQAHTPSIKSKSEMTMTPSTDSNILTVGRTHGMEGPLIKLSCTRDTTQDPALSRDTRTYGCDLFYRLCFPDHSVTIGHLTTVPVCCSLQWDSSPPPPEKGVMPEPYKKLFLLQNKSPGGQSSHLSKPLLSSHITWKHFPKVIKSGTGQNSWTNTFSKINLWSYFNMCLI